MSVVHAEVSPPKAGLALTVRRGQHLRVTDLEGKQVVDMALFNAENPREKLRVRPPEDGEKLDRSDPAFTPDPAMVRLLKSVQEGARAHTLSRATTDVPEDQKEILKALGYGK